MVDSRLRACAPSMWNNSAMLIHVAFPLSYFDQLGVPRLAA
jgi:hypothetical protein